MASLRAQAGVDEAQIADLADQLKRFAQLGRDRVATEDEVKRREFSLATARARALATAAAVSAAAEAVRQAGTDLDILTVRSPRDGRLLQVNLREGEFAAVKSAEPLMLLGDVDRFQVRAEVDEQDAVLIRPDQPAVASLKEEEAFMAANALLEGAVDYDRWIDRSYYEAARALLPARTN